MLGSRIRSVTSGLDRLPTIEASAVVSMPPDSNVAYVTGSGTIERLIGHPVGAGRMVKLIGAAGASVTVANTDGATSDGAMDLGGSNVSLTAGRILSLIQRGDGGWERLAADESGGEGGKGGSGPLED